MNELLAGIRERLEGDRVLWGIALVLTVASLVTVYSAISTLAYKADGNSAKFLFKQIGLLTGGWVVMFGVHRIHFKYFGKLANVLFVLAVAALVFTFLFGTDINDAQKVDQTSFHRAHRPNLGLRQTRARAVGGPTTASACPCLGRLVEGRDAHSGRHSAIVCLLILPSDFSTAAMLGAICVTMLFVGGLPWVHMMRIVGVLMLATGVSLYGIGKVAPDALPRFGTWANRMESFVGFATGQPNATTSAEDYQIELAQVAIHKGGLFPMARLPERRATSFPTPIPT